MPVTIRSAVEQARHTAYRLGVRAYLDTHPAPQLTDQPCGTCGAAIGKVCKSPPPRLDGSGCTARLVAHLDAVDAHRVAAQQAGHAAADTPQTV